MAFEAQMKRAAEVDGFIAALDQSGGSTPKALKLYGMDESMFTEENMFDKIHDMRVRIMTAKAFSGERVLGAILFENTMDRTVKDMPTPAYLWKEKNVVPFLKVDKGLAPLEDGCQIMKPIPGLDDLLKRAKGLDVFGTKMRSVIKEANAEGIKKVVDQQFEVGKQILAGGLVPIIEPEVDINSPDKAKCEEILKENLLKSLDACTEKVMLKLSLPSVDNFYKECVDHPMCLRVVALSGGYEQVKANEILAKQSGMIASFSRALTEGLTYDMTDEAYEAALDKSIEGIYQASKSG